MKIGYFVTNYPYHDPGPMKAKQYVCGGSSYAAYHLARDMGRRGHALEVFTTSLDSNDHTEGGENLTVRRYATNWRIYTTNVSLNMFTKPRMHETDLIHAHYDILPGPFACLPYVRKNKTPLVVTYHGDWVGNFGGILRRAGLSISNKILLKRLLNSADIIISPSQHYITQSGFLGKYLEKIRVVPNGVDLAEFDVKLSKDECRKRLGLPTDQKMILFLSHLSPYKNPKLLLDAMPEILKESPDAQLVYVGEGILKESLQTLSKHLGVEEKVKFIGPVEDDFEKAMYYNAADVFVLPSRADVFPLVLLEASAAGLPLVVSDLETFKCLIKEGFNGLFAENENPKDLAEKIVYLLENKETRERMGRNARKTVEEYSWERVARLTEDIYKELI